MEPSTHVNSPYKILSNREVRDVHSSALELLADLGMSEATPRVIEAALANGCEVSANGRLLFPRSVVEKCLDSAAKEFPVYGRDPAFDFAAKNGQVNFCTGGAAVTMLDPLSRTYRPSTLRNLYDLSRLCDRLENIQWFARPVVATDIEDPYDLDLNTIFACAAGTRKHIATSFSKGENVFAALPMLDTLGGGKGSFAKRPFCTVHATTVVSPMSFAPDSLDVACAAIDVGMPIHSQTGPQAGATAPATLAGTLVQVCAEGLASLCVINMIKPGHPVVMGNWAFVSDLRTGAFSGGGGEQALLCAAVGQMAAFYGIPAGMGAGMTDSKLPDNQAGFEKALSLSMASLSGAGFVYESAGMLASLLGCSFEAMVIDNDMLSSVRRIARGIEVTPQTLAVDVVKEAVLGPGHYLGAKQTLAVMKSEFTYPVCANRQSPQDWVESGAPDVREHAQKMATQILSSHFPKYMDDSADRSIRANYNIELPSHWAET